MSPDVERVGPPRPHPAVSFTPHLSDAGWSPVRSGNLRVVGSSPTLGEPHSVRSVLRRTCPTSSVGRASDSYDFFAPLNTVVLLCAPRSERRLSAPWPRSRASRSARSLRPSSLVVCNQSQLAPSLSMMMEPRGSSGAVSVGRWAWGLGQRIRLTSRSTNSSLFRSGVTSTL